MISPQSYVQWPHASFRISGRGAHLIDDALSALGLVRRVVCRLPDLPIPGPAGVLVFRANAVVRAATRVRHIAAELLPGLSMYLAARPQRRPHLAPPRSG